MSRKRKSEVAEAEISDTDAGPSSSVTHEEIALCAYYIWEAEGRPEGRAIDHWLQAELQLRATRTSDDPPRLEHREDQHKANEIKT